MSRSRAVTRDPSVADYRATSLFEWGEKLLSTGPRTFAPNIHKSCAGPARAGGTVGPHNRETDR
jgi:hypothetical protein